MTDRSAVRRIGLFGGTFDPVHWGHIRMATSIRAALNLDEMRLIPAYHPPHREMPLASAEQRRQMLEMAVAEEPDLKVDDRELRRGGVSYSYDTLRELRAELGDSARLAFCMGWDSLVSLPSWHRWRELLELTAMVAVSRPHHAGSNTQLPAALAERLRPAEPSAELESGAILSLEVEPLDISATHIRHRLAEGRPLPPDQVPEPVLNYIEQERLYRA